MSSLSSDLFYAALSMATCCPVRIFVVRQSRDVVTKPLSCSSRVYESTCIAFGESYYDLSILSAI